MNKSNTAITVSKIISLIQLISGVLLSIFFGLCIIYYVTDANYRVYVGVGFFITSLICEAIGIVLIVFSRKRKKLIKMFREYVSYISSNQNNEDVSPKPYTVGCYSIPDGYSQILEKYFFE